MKQKKRIYSLILALALVLSLAAPANVMAAVKLNRTAATLAIRQKTTLKVSGTTKTPVWSSSNAAVAAVSKSGIVTAKKTGTATITAKVGKSSYRCKITVKGNYKTLYKKVLETKSSAKWYYLLDVNKNGVPELLTTENVRSFGTITSYDVYAVNNGRAVLTGSYFTMEKLPAVPVFQYSSTYKGLYGLAQDTKLLFSISGGKMWTSHYAATYSSPASYYVGKDEYEAKKVSKTSYTTYCKKYFGGLKTYTMLKNTAANRTKSFS